MTKFSYQLYSSRKFGPIESTLEMVSQCGYRQVEAYGGLYADLDRLERALGVNSLVMPTGHFDLSMICLLYTSPSPRDRTRSRMPSSA